LCGSQDNLQRQQVKLMLRDWDKKFPGRVENIFRALANVSTSHLLDRTRYDFVGLTTTGVASADGDKVFDADTLCAPAEPNAPNTTTAQVISFK
jgi:tRNA 2-thiocytidine biosynthesis protein TtcA